MTVLDVKYDSLTWIPEKIAIESVVSRIYLRDRLTGPGQHIKQALDLLILQLVLVL